MEINGLEAIAELRLLYRSDGITSCIYLNTRYAGFPAALRRWLACVRVIDM